MKYLFVLFVMLISCGCLGYTKFETPVPEDDLALKPTIGEKIVRIDTKMYTDLDSNPLCIRFELTSIPEGVIIRRAVLRLRRTYLQLGLRLTRPPATFVVDVTNVNKGLLIRHIRFVTEKRGNTRSSWTEILDASQTVDEEDLWRKVAYRFSSGLKYYKGLQFLKVSWKGEEYYKLLQIRNLTEQKELPIHNVWDEIDVTSFVQSELEYDNSLTILLLNSVHMGWFDTNPNRQIGDLRNRTAFHPHLVVEFDTNGVQIPSGIKKPVPRQSQTSEDVAHPGAITGKIIVTSAPDHAEIYINGKFAGTTPTRELKFSEDELELEVRKKGYKSWKRTVTILKDNVLTIHAELEPEK